jgi:hypothetical protein
LSAERNPSSFTEPGGFIANSAGPIDRIGTEPDPAAKRGEWPVPHADGVAVLHRIEMDVIEVTHEVVLAAQGVLPVPPLPDPALGFGGAAGRDRFTRRQSMLQAASRSLGSRIVTYFTFLSS